MMSAKNIERTKENLEAIAKGDASVRDQLVNMLAGSYEESGLDVETFMLVRIAALAAMDASPASWLVNLKIGKELGIEPEKAIGTLVAIAPIIGTARIVSAAGSIVRAVVLDREMKDKK